MTHLEDERRLEGRARRIVARRCVPPLDTRLAIERGAADALTLTFEDKLGTLSVRVGGEVFRRALRSPQLCEISRGVSVDGEAPAKLLVFPHVVRGHTSLVIETRRKSAAFVVATNELFFATR